MYKKILKINAIDVGAARGVQYHLLTLQSVKHFQNFYTLVYITVYSSNLFLFANSFFNVFDRKSIHCFDSLLQFGFGFGFDGFVCEQGMINAYRLVVVIIIYNSTKIFIYVASIAFLGP